MTHRMENESASNLTGAQKEESLPIRLNYKPNVRYTSIRRPYKKYNKAEWSWKEVLDKALLLKEVDNNFLETISKEYGIVRDTLKYKLYAYIQSGNHLSDDNRGRSNKVMTDDQERAIWDIITKDYINKKLPFDNDCLKILAEKKWNEWYPNDKEFRASNGWCTDFKKRWKLSSVKPSKKRKTINQNEEAICKFLKECKDEYQKVGADHFFNMDETYWHVVNMVHSTFGHTGSESTQIESNGNDKQGFTAMFTISASGKFLDPIVIKKGKTARCLRSLHTPGTFQKFFSENGWVNTTIMISLLDLITKHTQGNPSVLLLDQFEVHTADEIKEEAIKRNIKLIYVPVGLTWKYQPLDVGINGPLKSHARYLWKKDRLTNPTKILKLNDGVMNLSIAIQDIIKGDIVRKAFAKALPLLELKLE